MKDVKLIDIKETINKGSYNTGKWVLVTSSSYLKAPFTQENDTMKIFEQFFFYC